MSERLYTYKQIELVCVKIMQGLSESLEGDPTVNYKAAYVVTSTILDTLLKSLAALPEVTPVPAGENAPVVESGHE